MKNIKTHLIIFSFLLLTFTINVNASSISISGATLSAGESKTLTISVSGGLMSADGDVSSNDTSCIQITSGSYFSRTSMESTAISSAGSVTIKAMKAGCSTTLKISNASVNTLDGDEERNLSFTSGTITVKEAETIQESTPAPSNNNTQNNSNNASSNNTSNASNNNTNNQSSGTSSASNSSNTNVTNASTNASSIIKKNGSSNNSLSSLSVTNYSLDKKFNTNTTSYSISVASDVKSINVNAKASDSKAKVTIYGTNSLKAGKNTVSVVVVAENGDKKTYTITVNKEKGENDPEEVVEEPQIEEPVEEEKSDDNNLNNIKPSIGILSPVFDKNKTKYVIYLPFEVEEISFETELSDPNATVEVKSVEKLKVGDNKYTFKVTAEDGSEKKYIVVVKRGIDPEVMDNKNSFLKALNLTGGKLTKKFDKNVYEYYYKGKNIKIKALAEDENANVDVIKNGDVYYVKVTSPSGETSIYTLRPYKFYNTLGFKIGIAFLGFVIGFLTKTLIRRRILKKKDKKVSSKNKKD